MEIVPKPESADRPQRNIALTTVEQWQEGAVSHLQDYLAVEEPLEIRLGNMPMSVTMRTPGHDRELAAGFLLTEGIIADKDELKGLEPVNSRAGNTIRANLATTHSISAQMQRNFLAASSCGICGKTTIDSIRVRGIKAPNREFKISPEVLCDLPEKLRQQQAVFGRTGGLHAAAAFDSSGEVLVIREDIGRHNAVDKVIGWALLNDHFPLSNIALMVSGRGGFEIVQKALVAEIPLLASVSAPSSLAVQLAREFSMTLVGFLRGQRFVIYSGKDRIKG